MNITNYIAVYQNTFSKEACENLITKFERFSDMHEAKSLETPDGWRMQFTQIQLDKHEVFAEENKNLQSLFLALIANYKKEHKITNEQWPKNFKLEPIRMKRYLPNSKDVFNNHVDVSDYTSSKRFLVAFIYLNDNFNGGETDFPQFQIRVKPQRGNMILFPPMWNWLHKSNPITGNNPKYIIGTYMHYL